MGAIQKILLVDCMESFHRRPLHDLILQRGNRDRSLSPVLFRNIDSPQRLRPVLPALQLSMELLDVFRRIPGILHIRDAVHSCTRVLPQALKCPFQRFHRQKVSDREKLPLPVTSSQFGYSGKFRRHAFPISVYRHGSLTRYVGLFPPSLQCVPWPPQLPWPCGSAPSSVIWVHKTAPSSFPAVSGLP